MIYIVCAFSSEARVFIESYKLKLCQDLPYPFFRSKDVALVVCGLGRESAMIATAALLGHSKISSSDLLVNVGICASNKHPIGTTLVANKLSYRGADRYSDILFSHSLEEVALTTTDEAQSSQTDRVVDMESFGVFVASSRFLETHQLLFVKVVSDHFQPEIVEKKMVDRLMRQNITTILDLISKALSCTKDESLFSLHELASLNQLESFFTKSQYNSLLDACKYYKLEHGSSLPDVILQKREQAGKRERSVLLDELICKLTS